MTRHLTYKQLDEILTSFGFQKSERETFLAFENPEYDAFVVLPVGTASTSVSPAHFLGVRRTVTEKGAATLDEWERAVNLATALNANATARRVKTKILSVHQRRRTSRPAPANVSPV